MNIPRVPILKLIALLPKLLSDRVECLRLIAQRYGDIVEIPIPGMKLTLVSCPKMVEHVLKTNFKNYQKSFDVKIVRDLLGAGPITSHGELWQSGRKGARAALTAAQLDSYQTKIRDITIKHIQAHRGTHFDGLHFLSSLSLDIFCQTLFGMDISRNRGAILNAVTDALFGLEERLRLPSDVIKFVPTHKQRRYKKAKIFFRQIIDQWLLDIDSVKEMNLLRSLIEFEKTNRIHENHPTWLHDQIMNYLFAGHETSAVALLWTLLILLEKDENDPIRVKLKAEALAFNKSNDVGALVYTEAAIKEGMRLFPPVWALGREACEEDKLGDYDIKKKQTVMVCPYIMHRKDTLWDKSDQFIPERFLEHRFGYPSEQSEGIQYFPFSAGARYCIGENFALMQLKIILATLIGQGQLTLSSSRSKK